MTEKTLLYFLYFFRIAQEDNSFQLTICLEVDLGKYEDLMR